jgi:NAD(P)-dependent dehydrogenase (short-subunit alcohol dehydrogenase family)
MAISLANTPITVNAISPGWIETNNYESLSESNHKQHPSGRVGKPRDIVNTCLFLTNKENDFINKCNIVVDGGMTKKMIYV